MRKTAYILAASLYAAAPALADPPAKPPPPPAKPAEASKEKMAVSPILGATTRDIMMPGKGMPKKPPASSH